MENPSSAQIHLIYGLLWHLRLAEEVNRLGIIRPRKDEAKGRAVVTLGYPGTEA